MHIFRQVTLGDRLQRGRMLVSLFDVSLMAIRSVGLVVFLGQPA